MILRLLGMLSTLLAGTLAAVSLLLFSDLDRALVLDGYVVFVGAVALHLLARATAAATTAEPSALDASRRRQAAEPRPDSLLRIDGLVSLATGTAGEFHLRLRPLLREAAASRLLARSGVALDAEPERASAALGPEAWALLRPDRPPPEDRFGPGPPLAALDRTVAAIERIGS